MLCSIAKTSETDSTTQRVLASLLLSLQIIQVSASELDESSELLDLEPDHTKDSPRVRRIKRPHLAHEFYRKLCAETCITDALSSLLGPNIRLRSGGKVNMKSARFGSPVEWHQDWAFYPHTNDDVLAVGVMIDDMTEDNGPIMFVPGSHRGTVYDHMSSGVFSGAVSAEVAETLLATVETITGRAGSVTFHHARLLHASQANRSGSPRRFLLYEVMAADAWPLAGGYGSFESWESMNERMVIGEQSTTPRLVDVPVRMPLPLPTKVTSIYQLQRDGNSTYYWKGTNR